MVANDANDDGGDDGDDGEHGYDGEDGYDGDDGDDVPHDEGQTKDPLVSNPLLTDSSRVCLF